MRPARRRNLPSWTPETTLKILAAALSASFCIEAAAVLPTNPVGSGFTAAQSGNSLTVTTATNRTNIGWDTFSIGTGHQVNFVQPSAASWVMNEVLGTPVAGTRVVLPSDIAGLLSSNGNVMLYNRAGIFIRPGAVIDVASFIATSLRLSEDDLFASRKRFTALPGAGTVSNEGTIRAASGGSVYLVAPNVENHGVITAPNGEILLAAGKSVELVDTGTPGVKIELTADAEQALNVGTLLAESGRIGLAGALVKNSGEINAGSAINDGGRIFLKATKKVEVDAAGRILANGRSGGSVQVDAGDMTLVAGTIEAKGSAGKGGRVELLGDKVGVYDAAQVDTSGTTGGGTILVGGDYQGKNSQVRNATAVYFGPQATLKSDATDNGDGGKVIVWANDAARAYGHISARGGANGGNGGFVETSGKHYLDVGTIRVDRSAPNGKAGTWLLDPENVTINTSSDFPSGGAFTFNSPGSVFDGAYGGSLLLWSTIVSNLVSGPVMVTTSPSSFGTGGNINFSGGPFTYNSPNAFWLVANQDIGGTNFTLSNGGSGDLFMIAGFSGTSLPVTPWDYASYSVTPGTGMINLIGSRVDTQGSIRAKAGSDVNVIVSSGGDNAWLKAVGNMTIDTWGDLNVRVEPSFYGGGGLSAEVSGGAQTISLHGTTSDINIAASNGTSYGGMALLKSGGAQTIDFKAGGTHTINVTGGYGGNVAYGAFAKIEANGNQQILKSGGGVLDIHVTAGDAGDGSLGDNYAFYGGLLICSSCVSHHHAEIEANGTQLIEANTITLTGGSSGTGNDAFIEADGAQTVNLSGALLVQGGSGGGSFIPGYGMDGLLGNSAGIGSDTSQVLNAGSITVNAGGTSTDYSGAFVFGPTQTITTTGNFTINGGGGSGTTSGLGTNLATAALVGFDTTANVTLNVGGTLSLTGGTGSSGPAMIGALAGTGMVDITAGSITTSGGGGGALIGSMTPVGTVKLKSTSGGISQSSGSSIRAKRLEATSNGGPLSLLGSNDATTIALTAFFANAIGYNSKSPFVHIESAKSGTGNITINANQIAGTGVGLGTLTTGGNVTVNSNGAIVDDNGTGVLNVKGNSVNLNSFYGGTAGLLAISADVEATTSLAADVANTAAYGGIRIFETANSLASKHLTDASSSSVGINFDTFGSIGAAFGAGSLLIGLPNTAAPVKISASGDISTASITLPANATDVAITAGNTLLVSGPVSSTLGSIYLSALGQIDITANVSALNDIGVLATGGNINFSGGSMSSGRATAMIGDIVTISGGGQITGAPAGVKVKGDSKIMIDGGSIDSGGRIELISISGDITVTNGGSVSNTGGVNNINVSAGGNLAVSYGGGIMAGDDVVLELTGAASEIRLDQGGKIVADMATGVPATIYADFTTRPSGGIFINGVETTTAATDGTGFFVVNTSTPATDGAGLKRTYVGVPAPAPAPATAPEPTTDAVDSQLVSTVNSTTTSGTNVTTTTPVEVLATATALNTEEEQEQTSAPEDTSLLPKEGTKDDGKQKPGQCT